MTDSFDIIFIKKPPLHYAAPDYVGKTIHEIIFMHPTCTNLPYCGNEVDSVLLEIRIRNATLSCVIKDYTCTEAYIFPD